MSLAHDLYAEGKFREAGSIFLHITRHLVSLEASQDAFNSLGAVLATLAETNDDGFQTSLLDHATAAFRAALSLNPHRCFGPGHHNLGIALASTRRWDDAMAAYHAALRCEPGHPTYLYSLGAAHLAAASPPQLVLGAFCDACVAAPTSPDAHLGLADALRDAGLPLAASSAFAAARRLAASPDYLS